MERPTRCSNRPESEGIDPCGSSSAIRSTRCIGKNSVGSPMRSPSGSITCRMKSSNEFKSMPRSVTPEAFMEPSEPHNISLGVCRLTMTMEFGSKNSLVSLPEWEAFSALALQRNRFYFFGHDQFRLGQSLHVLGRHTGRDLAQHQSFGRDANHGQFGHDHVHDLEARERQRALLEDLGLAVFRGVL